MVNCQPQPLISIVFVNYNSADFLECALQSLSSSELDKEVIVVDNASNERKRLIDLCQKHHALLVLLKRNQGYGRAANQGVRYARGRYVAVANPDIQFLPLALTRLVSFLDTHPEAGVVSPQLLYPDLKPQPSCRRFPKLRYVLAGRRSPLVRLFPCFAPAREFLYLDLLGQESQTSACSAVPVDAVIGTMMLFRREALEAVKGFDETYFMFAEDLDICQRLRDQGWEVFLEPRANIIHHYGGVRRRFRRFTEFQRIKGLHRFFTQRAGKLKRVLLTVGFAGYYFVLEAVGLLGLGEFEYSWQGKRR